VSERFDIIIVGGGIVGASVAYHLSQLGRYSVCLLERDQLTSGTTWHAAGLVAELRASANLTRLARYSGELYEQLEADGFSTGFKRVGAITLALNPERSIELKRQAAMARSCGIDCRWLTPAELSERWPHLKTSDVQGGVYMPRDGQTNPVDTTLALAAAARKAGVVVREKTPVRRLTVEQGRVAGVETENGVLAAAKVLLAAGLWTRQLALEAGANVPLYPCEHYYAVTEAVDLPGETPIVRVPDDGVYLKPDAGRLLIGSFEREAKPLDPASLPADFSFAELPFDLEHFAPYLASGLERLAGIAETGIRTWFNGPESFTPDGRYLLGESPELGGLFVAAGFNSIGIQSAGGVGRVMADWLDAGRPGMDLWDVDVRRFEPFQNQARYLSSRAAESLGLLYAMHWPYQQLESGRDQRRSPLHDRLAARGACFGELAGWERPNWYAAPGQPASYEYSYGKQNWFENARAEHLAVRGNVALFDQTSFAKFEISGPEACAFLNWLCTAEMDVAPGRIVYSQCLNEQGGIQADVTVTRLERDRYLYVTGAACRVRDGAWLKRHAADFDVSVADRTEALAVLGVMGPNARALLAAGTAADFSDAAFPFAASKEIELAGCPVRASRITYVGALGWELYMDSADAVSVFDSLSEAFSKSGASGQVPLAGYHAMDSLRLEKAYRHWGHDITDEDTPLEAGLSFTCAWQKPGGFLGREALLAQKAVGLKKRLALFALEDPEALLYHDEPIWADGERVGRITSGAFGHSLGRALGFGYVTLPEPYLLKSLRGRSFAVEIGEEMVPARISTRALYDPEQNEIR
jgi:4-methylaminobutanoate oxidase (formaldehyde-forming)